MITLTNSDSQTVNWYLMQKYDFDTNNALASGTLAGGASTTMASPTGTTVSVVWTFGTKSAAAGLLGDGGTSVFINQGLGTYCKNG